MWFAFLTVIVRVVLSPLLSMMFIGITHTSFWFAQIVRSARRGRTSGLDKEFVIGTTVCRLIIALCEFHFQPLSMDLWIKIILFHIDFISCPQNVLNIVPKCKCACFMLCFPAQVASRVVWMACPHRLPPSRSVSTPRTSRSILLLT